MKKQKKKNNQCPPAFTDIFAGARKPRLARSFKSSVQIILFLVAVFTVAFLVTRSDRASAQQKNSCVACHSNLEKRLSEPVGLFEHDIHRARGLSCNDCHGGDPTADDKNGAKDPLKGYLGKPAVKDIPAFCGKCHSDPTLMRKFNPSIRVDQVQEYFTSVHGERLRAGDQKVATCVSCHNVHGIRSPGDSLSSVFPMNVAETCSKCHSDGGRMQEYQIPSDQYSKYKASVHAKALYEKQDLSAPTCNDCHGNHGAVPPGINTVGNVCGQCHTRQSALFQNSPHKAAFEKLQAGECLKCHRNHDIMPPSSTMVGTGESSVCISCHTADKGFAVAGRMRARMNELQNGIHHATEILERAERAGMEVSRPKFELRDAMDNLTQARVLVHTSSLDEMETAIVPGMEVAAKSYQAGEAAFAELNFRRSGLVVSLVFILFLALLVYLKIRQMEREELVAE